MGDEDKDIKPTPHALFINENFMKNIIYPKTESGSCVNNEQDIQSHDLSYGSGRLSPEDRSIFAKDYYGVDSKRRKISNIEIEDNGFASNLHFQEEKFEVKLERDDIDEGGDVQHSDSSCVHHDLNSNVIEEAREDREQLQPIGSYVDLESNNLEGPKDHHDLQSVGDSAIASELETTDGHGEASNSQSSTSSPSITSMSRAQRVAARNIVKDRHAATLSMDRSQPRNLEDHPVMKMKEHNWETHIANLNLLCRICGRRCRRAMSTKKCPPRVCLSISYIEVAFGLNVGGDKFDTHSPYLCNSCRTKVATIWHHGISDQIIQKNATILAKSQGLWVPFVEGSTIEQCTLCHHCQLLKKGGRPKK